MGYFLSLLKHMILPVMAYTLSQIFLSIFSWRTFFLIYSSEDYVEMAKAKGLPARDINNKYILRPTLPTIITSFALLVIGSWTGAPIFETIFQLARPGARALPGGRPVRYPGDRRRDRDFFLPVSDYCLLTGHCLCPG